jgi:hypothetical protein
VIAENPPWLTSSPIFNFELTKYKKYFPNPLLIQQHFAEILRFKRKILKLEG